MSEGFALAGNQHLADFFSRLAADMAGGGRCILKAAAMRLLIGLEI